MQTSSSRNTLSTVVMSHLESFEGIFSYI